MFPSRKMWENRIGQTLQIKDPGLIEGMTSNCIYVSPGNEHRNNSNRIQLN